MKIPKFMRLSSFVGHKPWLASIDASIRNEYDQATNTPVTELAAMRVPGFKAAVTLLADSISIMPLRLKRRDEQGVKVITDHPVAQVLRDPDSKRPAFTGQAMLRCLAQSVLIHGNAYLEQVRVQNDRKLFSLRLIDPCRVDLEVKNGEPIYKVATALYEQGKVTPTQSIAQTLTPPEILHFKGDYTDAEGYMGVSPLYILRDALRVSIEQQYHAKSSLVGGNVKGFVTFDSAELSAEQVSELQKVLNDPKIDGKWKVLMQGAKPIYPTATNVTAQFIEGRRLQLTEIARFFRIPLHLLMEVTSISNWGGGLSVQASAFVAYTLLPIATRIEDTFNQSVLTKSERDAGYFLDFAFDNLLRGSQNERADFYAKAIASGWMSPAEVRRIEDMTEVGGLDNYKPVDSVPVPTPTPEPIPQPSPGGQNE